jgi:hypothetical protein
MKKFTALWPTALSVSVTLFVSCGTALAHGGGLDASGCHHNRRTGDYHCHRPQRTASEKFDSAQNLLGSGGGVFANCSAARAAGAVPVRIGDPGYGPHLDRDHDGIGCE